MLPLLGGPVGVGPKRRAIVGAEVMSPAELLEVFERTPHRFLRVESHMSNSASLLGGEDGIWMSNLRNAVDQVCDRLDDELVPFAQAPTVIVRPSTVD
eukprot:10361007-Heterocapsa_arctica.AAC.1